MRGVHYSAPLIARVGDAGRPNPGAGRFASARGRAYSLRDALRDPDFSATSLVIGIFMTFFDVHVNRIPYPGLLSYKGTDAIDTYNLPMLDVETSILQDLRISTDSLEYLHHNQRI